MSIREHSFSIDEVIWLPFWQQPDNADAFLFALKGLSEFLKGGSAGLNKSTKYEYDRLWTQLCKCLNGKNVLFVVDPKTLQHGHSISAFLSDIFGRIGANSVAVILVCEDGFDSSVDIKCTEAELTVVSLDF